MKILVFTTLYPNSQMPNHGVFVKRRIEELAKEHEVVVAAPVPWFPKLNINKKWFKFSEIPAMEYTRAQVHKGTSTQRSEIAVYHPRYFITPKILRSLYGFFMFWSVAGFVKTLQKEFDFDLIDANFVYPDGLAAVLLGKVLGKKVVVTARGTDINWYPRFRIRRKLIQYTLKKADSIISVSETLKGSMIKLGIEKEKIKVIFNGVDSERFYRIDKREARKQLNLSQDKKILLGVGDLIERKGYYFLIEALKLIGRKNVELLIIGEGAYRAKLGRIIKEHGLWDKVRLLGAKPQDELYKWYSAADVFCLTSLREGRPNVILEALACGTPVISMDNWGLRRLVDDNRGILLDSYEPIKIREAIEEAVDKNWDREKISLFMKDFSWDKTTQDVAQIFKDMVRKKDILFFSSDDWDSGLKTSKYHLSTRLARESRVIFINSFGLRRPMASKKDIGKIFRKLGSFFKGARKVSENLYAYTPIIVPFQNIRFIRFINNLAAFVQIKIIMNRFEIKNPYIWTFIPNSLGVIRMLPKKKLIYYSVDDMSAFKGVEQDIIRGFDEELTREANFVFTVSKELFHRKSVLNKNTFYSPHGVDFELFNKAMREDVERPIELKDINGPIVGFYGLISGDWVDYELVRFIAENKPSWSIVMIGKIDEIQNGLPRAQNIHYFPVKPYEELYKYSKFFDAAILPFNMNNLTMHSHPLKILEYLSAGRPVVSVNIPEAMKYKEVIEIAVDYKGFVGKIEKCLKENSKEMADERIKFAKENSWEKRFNEIQNTIYSYI